MALQTKNMVKLLLLFIIFTVIYDLTESCSCLPTHPQTHYCNADYVIIARILRKSSTQNSEFDYAYKIKIEKIYKMSEKAENYLKSGRILTANNEAACGVNLKTRELYLIAGRGPRIGLCDYVVEYPKMPIVERHGFAGSYKKGCYCKIKYCSSDSCPLEYGTCNWKLTKCETRYGLCVPSRNIKTCEGVVTECNWSRTPEYKECLTRKV